jgi:hypothetical protein
VTTVQALAVLALAACAPLVPPADAGTSAGALPLPVVVDSLPVAAEVRTGYSRDRFRHWIDQDGDGCDTRDEVLIAEAVTTPRIETGCRLTGGAWLSYYDRRTWTDAGRVDIDHMVPLAEAWDSGAWRWTPARREAYANDLGDPRSLVGVTDTANRQKSDQDPAEWLPMYDRCRYLGEFIAVKLRWRLSVDATEKAVMKRLAAECPNVTITIVRP